jgi:transcriptional regulator with XRE-family HTH domain
MVEELADYVKRIRKAQGWSLNEVARRSGGGISNGYISQIENRYYINPTRDKLIALAKGLGVTEAEIFAVATRQPIDEGSRRTEEHLRLIEMFNDIPRQCQQDVLDLLEVLQRNHSLSARKDRRQIAAEAAGPRVRHGGGYTAPHNRRDKTGTDD